MKLKKVLAGLMAAVTAVTASVCGLSVSAGAVSEKKEYSGSWYVDSLPPIRFKSSDDTRESGVYYESIKNGKGTDAYVLEDIKPTDVITYYATTPDGVEYVLNIGILTETSYLLTSRSDTNFYEESGISVQDLINEFNNDLHEWDYDHTYDGQNVTFDSVYGISPYYRTNFELIDGDYVNSSPFAALTGKVNWRVTIEPGDGKSPSKPNDTDNPDNDQQDEIAISKKIRYTGHADSIKNLPAFEIYDNMTGDRYITSAGRGETDLNVDWAGADVSFSEAIKPYDIVTYSVTLPSGKKKKLNVTFRLYDSSAITSDVIPSGITVQKMVEKYNEELKRQKASGWFKDAKYITYKDIWAIYVSGDGQQDYKDFKWTFTIEPGKPSNVISDMQFSDIKDQPYTGKAIKPAVTIKDGTKKLVKGTNYTVSYKKNTKIGTATVTVTGKGNYTGTKTVTFNIVPKKVKVTSKTTSRSATLSWKKSAGATGYEIYRSYYGDNFMRLTNTKSLKYTAKLTAGKSYQFKVIPYTIVNGKKFYGSWSNVVKTK
ncbi:MAG: fibronectin type III domain-containing protein [Oscillospiraceae bacterium]|nr:fibronectin type III domain-containing protein [Oscillospiraceae bacterium]MBP1579891.1 fibronectin type III domain-containing protein [Oscillospiraceae bacterium]